MDPWWVSWQNQFHQWALPMSFYSHVRHITPQLQWQIIPKCQPLSTQTHPGDEQSRSTDSLGQSHWHQRPEGPTLRSLDGLTLAQRPHNARSCVHGWTTITHTQTQTEEQSKKEKRVQNRAWFSKNMKILHILPNGCNLYLSKTSLTVCDSSYGALEANRSCPRVLLSVRIIVKPSCKACVASPLCCNDSVRTSRIKTSLASHRMKGHPPSLSYQPVVYLCVLVSISFVTRKHN